MAPLFVWELKLVHPGNDEIDLGLYESRTKAQKDAQKNADEWRAMPGHAMGTPAKLRWHDGNGSSSALHLDEYSNYWIQKRKVVH